MSRICIKSHLLSFEYRVKINCDNRTRSILTDTIYRKHKECNGIKRIALAKSAMERIPLHSWEMEFSVQYHVTMNSQLNDQNSIRYCILYIVCCMLYVVCCMLYVVCCMLYVVCCMLFAVCCMLYAVCGMRYAVCCMRYAVCCMLYAVCCMLYVVCCILYVVYCILYGIHVIV